MKIYRKCFIFNTSRRQAHTHTHTLTITQRRIFYVTLSITEATSDKRKQIKSEATLAFINFKINVEIVMQKISKKYF